MDHTKIIYRLTFRHFYVEKQFTAGCSNRTSSSVKKIWFLVYLAVFVEWIFFCCRSQQSFHHTFNHLQSFHHTYRKRLLAITICFKLSFALDHKNFGKTILKKRSAMFLSRTKLLIENCLITIDLSPLNWYFFCL